MVDPPKIKIDFSRHLKWVVCINGEKDPQKGRYVTINTIPYRPVIDYFQPHYLDITSNYTLSRKNLIKKQNTKLVQFMEGRHGQLGTSLILSAISAEILSAWKNSLKPHASCT